PTVSGTTSVGSVLKATTGTWSNSPSSYAYSWRRCDSGGANCSAISGATTSSYTLTSSDLNFTERVVVTATNTAGSGSATIAHTPTWARPSTCNTSDKCVPANNADYGNFCGAAARHYLPMGVHYWEVWNEPNLTAFFQPKPDVVKYVGMLKACYTAIKAVDPSATVVTGGTSPAGSYNAPCSSACSNVNGINWLEGIYANGGKGYFDAVGHHPYSFPSPPSTVAGWSAWYQMFGTSPSLRSVMVANGDGDKKIWGTEWGAPTNGPAGSGFVSESTQAAQVTEAYTLWKSYTWT